MRTTSRRATLLAALVFCWYRSAAGLSMYPPFCTLSEEDLLSNPSGGHVHGWDRLKSMQLVTPLLREEVCNQPVLNRTRSCYGQERGRHVCLPSFVGVGFAKCGTSKLFSLLDLHPDICGSNKKEAELLLNVSAWPATLHDAFSVYKPQDTWRNLNARKSCNLHGEFSPGYVDNIWAHHLFQTHLPQQSLFIAVLCDPVQRAYSHYRFFLKGRNPESTQYGCDRSPTCFPRNETFRFAVCTAINALGGEKYLRAVPGGNPLYPFPVKSQPYPYWNVVVQGFQFEMLAPILDIVGRHRLLLVSNHDMATNPGAVLLRVFKFLHLPALSKHDWKTIYTAETLFGRVLDKRKRYTGTGGDRALLDDSENMQLHFNARVLAFLQSLYAESISKAADLGVAFSARGSSHKGSTESLVCQYRTLCGEKVKDEQDDECKHTASWKAEANDELGDLIGYSAARVRAEAELLHAQADLLLHEGVA